MRLPAHVRGLIKPAAEMVNELLHFARRSHCLLIRAIACHGQNQGQAALLKVDFRRREASRSKMVNKSFYRGKRLFVVKGQLGAN
jgi:hypothetical protein